MAIVDIHSHLYPGIDDGASDEEMTVEMLKEAEKQGVTSLFMTPHSEYLDTGVKYDFKKVISKLQLSTKIKLYLGCEIYCCEYDIKRIIGNIKIGVFPTMNGSEYVLIEFPNYGNFEQMRNSLKHILLAGYRPIIAHCERYYRYVDTVDKVENLKNDGNLIQVNSFSLSGEENKKIHSLAMGMLERGLIDFIGSDAHRTSHRNVSIADGIEVVKQYEFACDLLYKNAEKYLL